MEGSVLSFLKAEWKVSDTGSAHWASSLIFTQSLLNPPFCNLHRGHSIDDSYQVSVVAMFANRSGQNEHSLERTFHRCFLPSFGSFGQAVSEEEICLNKPIRNKNCLWQPCLLMDRDEMSNRNRGFSIDASYHVSIHLANRFQRGEDF
jgi:hypothetical protein